MRWIESVVVNKPFGSTVTGRVGGEETLTSLGVFVVYGRVVAIEGGHVTAMGSAIGKNPVEEAWMDAMSCGGISGMVPIGGWVVRETEPVETTF